MSPLRKSLLLAAMCVATATFATATCEAGPILDWLNKQKRSKRQALPAVNDSLNTYRFPASNYSGSPYANGYWANLPQQNALTSNYAPTTAYRSLWAPVPVTTYSPVAYQNPLSGGVTSQPCTSYEWQARRVPFTTYQPSFGQNPTTAWSPTTAQAPSPFQVGSEWTPVGSAATLPGFSGRGATNAGYATATEFSPVAPASAVIPVITNSNSVPAANQAGASEWQPVAPAGSQKLQAVPADRAPELRQRPTTDDGETSYYDQRYRQMERDRILNSQRREEPRLVPVFPSAGTRNTTPNRSYGATVPQYAPPHAENQELPSSYDFSNSQTNSEVQQTTTQPPRRSAPLLRPIPDPERQRMLDSDEGRTAQRVPRGVLAVPQQARPTTPLAAPRTYARTAPINWNQVDIQPGGEIIRTKAAAHSSPSTPDQYGWRAP